MAPLDAVVVVEDTHVARLGQRSPRGAGAGAGTGLHVDRVRGELGEGLTRGREPGSLPPR